MNIRIFFILFLISALYALRATGQDVDTLPTVELRGRIPANVAASSTGVQELAKKDLELSNSLSVADAVKYFSGVLVKDYGGIGGLKTISVRSLGANHTGVMYDGMVMADARAGLIDLGRISTENLEYIRLYQSNADEILLPARSFASANLLVLATPTALRTGITESWFSYKHGSFGFINPSAGFSTSLGSRASLRLTGSYQKTHGSYHFEAYDGTGKSERRNGDVEQWRAEVDIPVLLKDSSSLKAKMYFYQSNRGLPGSVLLYNESANERLDNMHWFAQLNWRKNLFRKWKLLLGAKSLFDRQKYFDPDFLNNEGFLENDFYQTENYLSAALGYDITSRLRASLSSDYFANTLKRRDPFSAAFANPTRRNFLNNAALTYTRKRFNISGNVLSTHFISRSAGEEKGKHFQKATPALSVSLQPVSNFPLRVRGMYKEIFRAPTLDDMYFTFVGNTDLKPEYSTQLGGGLTWQSFQSNKFLQHILITADGYLISVKDKILALPRNNLFQWSMMNVGKAKTKSFDVGVEANMRPANNTSLQTNITYSYQDARDVSSPAAAGYKNLLPYIPQHSGSSRVSVERGDVSVSWNSLFSSHRYRVGDQTAENLVEGYALHDLHISYAPMVNSNWTYKVSAQVNNILNKQYEVVKYFPMPGMNWRVSLIVNHKKIKKAK